MVLVSIQGIPAEFRNAKPLQQLNARVRGAVRSVFPAIVFDRDLQLYLHFTEESIGRYSDTIAVRVDVPVLGGVDRDLENGLTKLAQAVGAAVEKVFSMPVKCIIRPYDSGCGVWTSEPDVWDTHGKMSKKEA